jgi:hypothetical protein
MSFTMYPQLASVGLELPLLLRTTANRTKMKSQ